MRILKNYKVHWITDGGNAFVSKRATVFLYSYSKDSFQEIIKLKYKSWFKNLFSFGLAEKLLRGGIHHILKENNISIIFFDNRIFRINNSVIESVYDIKTCKRPLNICFNNSTNSIYWGDYIASKKRYPINVYYSNDFSKTWNVCNTFKSGTVRHIHNIIYDKYNKRYLVLTGDKDKESGIWETKDFSVIKPLLVGKQKYRATSLIPMKEGLIIPTDTELEKNYIQYYSYSDKQFHSIMKIPSSSIDAQRIDGISFVCTMAEPSSINNTQDVKFFGCIDNKKWIELFSERKKCLSPKYFQYPAVTIPLHEDYNAKTQNYYFNIKNTKRIDGVAIYSKKELLELMI